MKSIDSVGLLVSSSQHESSAEGKWGGQGRPHDGAVPALLHLSCCPPSC